MGTATMDIATANVVNASVSDTADIRRYKTVAPTVTKTANYTTTELDDVILVDASGGARTITLHASPDNGKVITVKKIDSSLNVVTVDPDAANLIDGVATLALMKQWDAVEITAGNANEWHVTAIKLGALSYKTKATDTTNADTTAANAVAIVTFDAFVFNGIDIVDFDFQAIYWEHTVLAAGMFLTLWDGATDLGIIQRNNVLVAANRQACSARATLTPSAASHTYAIKVYADTAGTVTVGGGGGGVGVTREAIGRMTRRIT